MSGDLGGGTTDLRGYLRAFPRTGPARLAVQRGAELLLDAASRHLAGRVLDVGCGTKAKRRLVGSRVVSYVGLDHAASLHGLDHVDVVGTATALPCRNASFDGIVCTAVLEHLEEPVAALRESLRVLKPGAPALYTVPLFWHLHEEPRDFFRYTEHGLRHVFGVAGYEIVELCPASGFWLTAASAWGYYLHSVMRGPLRPLAWALCAAASLFVPWLDRLDQWLHPEPSRLFPWMYLVVARRPTAGGVVAPGPGAGS